ncbi:hypothetical protein ACWDX6_27805 [Streptomyces sp. NPDC003027]
MVAEIYHELLFSELQAGLFANTQEKVDGASAGCERDCTGQNSTCF